MSHVQAANGYVEDVLSGAIPACKWIKLACERHLRDLKNKSWQFRFDQAKAERVCKFIELLPHVKGKWATGSRQPLRLSPWQAFLTCSIYGWVNKETGARRFRKARLYVPRKNGKSSWAAPVGIYMLAADGEVGSEVYSGATTEKQAWEVFSPAREMIKKTPQLIEKFGIQVNARTIVIPDGNSKFEAVIGKPGDGSSPHCSIIDEYHEHDTDDQMATMETGMGAREQPLSLVISTAGDNLAGPCRDDWLQCQKILERTIVDERTFALIYTIDSDDDWRSEAALRKANPNYDVSVSGEFLQAQLKDAIENARKQGKFKTKHLNMWVQARDAYINMQKWAQCKTVMSMQDMKGKPCFIGVDLASKVDIAAVEIVFVLGNDTYARFGKYYLPEKTVEALDGNGEAYRKWRDQGILTVTDGDIIDFNVIKHDIISLCLEYGVSGVGYDPHQATMLVTQLQEEGIPVVEFRPTVLNFSEPMKTIEALTRSGGLMHDGDEVMTWAMSNVVAKSDAKDNVYPRKEREENKIDPFVALCMAMGLAMTCKVVDVDDWLDNMVIA